MLVVEAAAAQSWIWVNAVAGTVWRGGRPAVGPGWPDCYLTATAGAESLSGSSHVTAGFERVNGKSRHGQVVDIPHDCAHGCSRSRQFD